MNREPPEILAQPGAHEIPIGTRIPYYLTALAMALPAIMLGLQLSGWIGFWPMIRDGHADFRNLYTAGYMVRLGHGDELYDYEAQKRFQDALISREDIAIPFIRPAYQALLFAPFSFLAFREAYFAFLVLNLATLGLCSRLLRPYTSNLSHVWPGLPGGMLLFLPIAAALMQGQDSIILLTLMAGALACLQHDRQYLAGALIALGLFKFQFVIPIALLFMAWRRWRFLLGFGISAAVLAAVSLWVSGARQTLNYASSVAHIGATQTLGSGLSLPVDHMANLHGAMAGIFANSPVVVPLTVVASAATMVFAATRRPAVADMLLIAIPVSALVSYYMFIHDMSVLQVPLALTLDKAVCEVKNRDQRTKVIAAGLLFAAPACMSFIPAGLFWIVSFPLLGFALGITIRPPQLMGTPIPSAP